MIYHLLIYLIQIQCTTTELVIQFGDSIKICYFFVEIFKQMIYHFSGE